MQKLWVENRSKVFRHLNNVIAAIRELVVEEKFPYAYKAINSADLLSGNDWLNHFMRCILQENYPEEERVLIWQCIVKTAHL